MMVVVMIKMVVRVRSKPYNAERGHSSYSTAATALAAFVVVIAVALRS